MRKYRTEEEKGQKKEGTTEQIKIKYRKNEKEHDPHRGYHNHVQKNMCKKNCAKNIVIVC